MCKEVPTSKMHLKEDEIWLFNLPKNNIGQYHVTPLTNN